MSNQYLILAAAALFAAAPLAAQGAASPFEGRWAIVAVSDDGDCDKTYRLPVNVEDGAIRYAGRHAVAANGQIDSTGQLTMTLAHDGEVVKARGRLGAQIGNGKWVSSGCAGAWTAHKASSTASSR
jgi:hypothetical protein